MDTEKNQESQEMARFNTALRGALSLSKADLIQLTVCGKVSPNLKQKPGRNPKSAASGHASSDKD